MSRDGLPRRSTGVGDFSLRDVDFKLETSVVDVANSLLLNANAANALLLCKRVRRVRS